MSIVKILRDIELNIEKRRETDNVPKSNETVPTTTQHWSV